MLNAGVLAAGPRGSLVAGRAGIGRRGAGVAGGLRAAGCESDRRCASGARVPGGAAASLPGGGRRARRRGGDLTSCLAEQVLVRSD